MTNPRLAAQGYSVFLVTILGFLFNVVTAMVIAVLPDNVPEGNW